jgi:hypothetical protein
LEQLYRNHSEQRDEQIYHGKSACRELFLPPFQAVTVKPYDAGMKFTLHVIIAISCALSSAMAQSPILVTAFTNPAPSTDDLFGGSVAALGNDRVVIGASGRFSGYPNPAVYLFTTGGQLLTAFTNPIPTDNIFYGESVAAVGTDRVLVGSYQSGFISGRQRAYLFNTNGALVATFTNPPGTGGSSFGRSAAALGSDRVLIGAPFDFGGQQEGLVHLFSTNGEWLNACTNPAAGSGSRFGSSVKAVGSDQVLIGAPGDDLGVLDAGAAYLFSTNGALTATFTNPTPLSGELFGSWVAAFGSDRVLIGAPRDHSAAPFGGAAYLFGTNGVLLTTFTNPSPAYSSTGFEVLDGDGFGSVAAVGNDRVLIGAGGNDAPNGTRYAGTVYMFSTNGTLLATLNNPVPTFGGSFGGALAGVGSDRVLIGAPASGFRATNAGRAYLFSMPPPLSLSIRLTVTNTVAVSWPSAATSFVLQQNTNALGSVNWSNVTGTIQDNGTNRLLIVNPPAGNHFYRLVKP